mmetsp:Transcript_38792/g.58972  ORF Transcript_38792/g.58972 Transcript_38792/m.58972 type:complete len:110 (+) Transcript_38792:185-514(+)
MLMKRSDKFGTLVIMVEELIFELVRFFIACGAVLVIFFAILRYTHDELKITGFDSFYQTFEDIINAFIGVPDSKNFKHPYGLMYILSISFTMKILLFSFMVTMFILRCI